MVNDALNVVSIITNNSLLSFDHISLVVPTLAPSVAVLNGDQAQGAARRPVKGLPPPLRPRTMSLVAT